MIVLKKIIARTLCFMHQGILSLYHIFNNDANFFLFSRTKIPFDLFMPPPLKKLRGHFGLGLSVRLSVYLSVRLSVRNTFWQLRNSRTAYARILKFYIWHVHENKRTRIFFHRRSCRSGVMPLFRLCMNNLVSRISEKPLRLGS